VSFPPAVRFFGPFLWQIAVAAAFSVPMVRLRRRVLLGVIRERKIRPAVCVECGYDLRVTTGGVCPECGEPI
jgi:hypothetical protein